MVYSKIRKYTATSGGRNIIVAKKKQILLNNISFASLTPCKSVCPETMKYIAAVTIPTRIQIEFVTGFSMKKLTISLVSVLRYSTQIKKKEHFLKFLRKLRNPIMDWQEINYDCDVDLNGDTTNSGIYVLHYMQQYSEHGVLRKSNISTHIDTLRQSFKNKILSTSDVMKSLCVHCGTSNAGNWGNCSICNRWVHSNATCEPIDIKEIEKMQMYKCIVCIGINQF